MSGAEPDVETHCGQQLGYVTCCGWSWARSDWGGKLSESRLGGAKNNFLMYCSQWRVDRDLVS